MDKAPKLINSVFYTIITTLYNNSVFYTIITTLYNWLKTGILTVLSIFDETLTKVMVGNTRMAMYWEWNKKMIGHSVFMAIKSNGQYSVTVLRQWKYTEPLRCTCKYGLIAQVWPPAVVMNNIIKPKVTKF
jgi:hypothetical protein